MIRLRTQFNSDITVAPAKPAEPSDGRSRDSELFARFLAGDDAAFMELFDRHTHRLYMYCLKFVGNGNQADDLVQDLWERVIKLRNGASEPILNPLGFLLRIARNLCLNHIRDRRVQASLEELSEWEHPVADTRELTHHEELVVLALEHLPLAQREVLILHAYSGYRFEEIAEMLGEPVGAIRTRAWRARLKLGGIISSFLEFEENNDEHGEHGTHGREADT